MPKIPPIKARELIKLLIKLGFHKHHQSGSHVQLKHLDGRRVTIPNHPTQEIRRGTLSGILKDIHIEEKDFLKLLKKHN